MSISERIFETKLNSEITPLQAELSKVYGWDNPIVISKIRELTAEARQQKSVQPIVNYRQHVLGQ